MLIYTATDYIHSFGAGDVGEAGEVFIYTGPKNLC